MSMPADGDDLWNEAMALLLGWQARPQDEASRDAVRRFCLLSPAHRAAWEEAKRVYDLAGTALVEERGRQRRITRRKALAGLGTIGIFGAGALFGPSLLQRWRADYTTAVAEIRRIPLPDGSLLTLGPETAVTIAFDERVRRVEVLDGMALCDVAANPRPFEGDAGDLRAVALGTRFELRHNDDRALVAVEEGVVSVSIGARGEGTLDAGDWLAAGPGGAGLERGHRDPGQTAAWRQKLLVAERDRVGTVVAEIARWRTGKVLVADPGLSGMTVSGLYDLSDPDAALAAVVAPYGGRVRHISPWVTVLSRL